MMAKESLTRKAINFDLDDADLRQHYPKKNYKQAYSDIEKFFCSHDFEHRQRSGYSSCEKMNTAQVVRLILKMKSQMPWLSKCVRRFDVTEIGETYDLTDLIKGRNKPVQVKMRPTNDHELESNIKRQYVPSQPTRKSKIESISGVVRYIAVRKADSKNEKVGTVRVSGERESEATVRFSKKQWDEKMENLKPSREVRESSIDSHKKHHKKDEIAK